MHMRVHVHTPALTTPGGADCVRVPQLQGDTGRPPLLFAIAEKIDNAIKAIMNFDEKDSNFRGLIKVCLMLDDSAGARVHWATRPREDAYTLCGVLRCGCRMDRRLADAARWHCCRGGSGQCWFLWRLCVYSDRGGCMGRALASARLVRE